MIRYIFLQRLKQNSTEGFTATLIYQSTYKSPRNNRNDSYNKLLPNWSEVCFGLILKGICYFVLLSNYIPPSRNNTPNEYKYLKLFLH